MPLEFPRLASFRRLCRSPRFRLLGVALLTAAGVTAAISCQQGKPTPVSRRPAANVPAAATGPSEGGSAEARQAPGGPDSPEMAEARKLGLAYPVAPSMDRSKLRSADDITAANAACLACHGPSDNDTMHVTSVSLTCVDCHGGNGRVNVPNRLARGTADYERYKRATHVRQRDPNLWNFSARTEILFTTTLKASADYVRFINPGDLRAAKAACGGCHNTKQEGFIVDRVTKSMMNTSPMLWEAALYNNGAINRKHPIYGNVYDANGKPAELVANPLPTVYQYDRLGFLPALFPLPRWEITQPGNILRVFERGGRITPEIGIQEPEEEPGAPDVKLSVRGFGTLLRTDPVFIGLQKTRLLDPTLGLFGTNDHPGDYRASGCSGCHVPYANDRSVVHSAKWAAYGNRGESFSTDPAVNPSATTQPYADPNDYARPPRESGHPIKHQFASEMNSSSCIVCHIHPGTNVLNSYFGYLWWDNESDGQFMYPRKQHDPTSEQEYEVSQHNPEGTAPRGLWSDLYPNDENQMGQKAGPAFLENVTRLNPQLRHMHFADFHGHGWVFRAVFKQDRHGNMLDHAGKVVENVDGEKMGRAVEYQWKKPGDHPPDGVPVHLKDVHLERGMQCVDCHFKQDNHGDGNIIGETRAAVMVDCIDCHGSPEKPAAIVRYLKSIAESTPRDARRKAQKEKAERQLLLTAFTGTNAKDTDDEDAIVARNKQLILRHFSRQLDSKGNLVQLAALDPKQKWTVVGVGDTISPRSAWATDKSTDARSARLARFAHSVRRDPSVWGTVPAEGEKVSEGQQLAHASSRMSCYACHSSWNTSCFGCHLPQRANQRKPMLHNEGQVTRNYTTYNFQTLRDDVYMLGVDGTTRDHKIVPIRSACAVVVSSQNALRDWIYVQQQTVSAEGYAGTAFTPYFPHTVRGTETKQCTDCHLSKNGDNNAIMAQLLLQGTNAVNFIGRFAYVGEGDEGLEGVAVTERTEPQAVFGSRLHEMAYPDNYRKHLARGGKLTEGHSHEGHVYDLQARGEYLYAACGEEGFIAYDIANVDNKDFSERIMTSPVSELGQRFYVKSKFATSICSPSTLAIDPTRARRPENEEGKITALGDPDKVLEASKPISLFFAFLYLTDKEEGLIVVGNPLSDKVNKPGVATLLDGDPDNNFLQRALTYNPGGLLRGARHCDVYGTYLWISCDAGIVVLDMQDPLHPRHVTTLSNFNRPREVQFQFRYGFVVDGDGVHVIDVTSPESPRLTNASVPIRDARDLYVSRTYGYVAAGAGGLVILDLEKPEEPKIDQVFTDGGRLNDVHAVRTGMTNASMFAYVADGKNGLKVIQLTSPDDTPTYLGFSPRPKPRVIAWYPTNGPAIALSEGYDRDRAVDESGNQLAVFGRRGARPFTLEEQQTLYMQTTPDGKRQIFTVSDEPWTKPLEPAGGAAAATKPAAESGTGGGGRPRFPGRRP